MSFKMINYKIKKMNKKSIKSKFNTEEEDYKLQEMKLKKNKNKKIRL
jgi:hypothetical protein